VLGALGITVIYLSCREEVRRLIEKFGDEYRDYMTSVPGMNVFLGLFHLIKNRK